MIIELISTVGFSDLNTSNVILQYHKVHRDYKDPKDLNTSNVILQ